MDRPTLHFGSWRRLRLSGRGRWLAIVAFSLAPILTSAQTVYQWVDEHGRVQYTQTRPPAGVEIIDTIALPPPPSAERVAYCENMRLNAQKVAQLKRAKVAETEATDAARQFQSDPRTDLNEPTMRLLVAFIYGGANALRTDVEELAERTHAHCLAGGLGDVGLAPKPATVEPAEAPEVATEEAVDSEPELSFGTGWISNGLVVTSNHLVAGSLRLRVVFANGRQTPAFKTQVDAQNNLALLRVGGDLPLGLPLAASAPVIGTDVFVLNRAEDAAIGQTQPVTGTIRSLSGFDQDPRTLQISVPISPRQSGGPLLNQHGEVVGLVVTREVAADAFNWRLPASAISEYAIRIEPLRDLLARIPSVGSNGQPQRGSLRALADRARSAMVVVIAER